MSTGISLDDNVINTYTEFKQKNLYRFLILGVSNDDKSIVLLKSGPPTATYEEFLGELPGNDCRYGILKYDYTTEDDGSRTKIVFFMWAPEGAKTKSKMMYAGSKETLKKGLIGIQIEIQGTDQSEVSEEEVLAKCRAISK